MAWSFSTDRPIFQQIADIIVLKIISGEYPPGYRLNAVRDLALEAGVNPNLSLIHILCVSLIRNSAGSLSRP